MNATLEQIQLLNTHWATNQLTASSYSYRRQVFFQMNKWLEERVAISIQGLRRTGKSVLQEQLRDEYVELYSLTPRQVLFFSFENDDYARLLPTQMLEEVLEIYFSRILNSQAQLLQEHILICIDEVQNVNNWQSVVKRYYDLNPQIKFILTGSSSLYLNDSSESLVGRVMDFIVDPLCFGEFLEITGEKGLETVKSFDDLFVLPPQPVSEKRQLLFDKFLLIGGFPESALMMSRGVSIIEIQKYLFRSIISKILTKDLQKYFSLDFIDQDLVLFKLLCNETGSTINYKRLARDVGLSEEKVAKHFKTFEKASLLQVLNRFDPKLRKVIKAHPKSYVASPCLIFSYLGNSSIPPGSLIGHVVEGYVHARLKQLCRTEELYFSNPSRNTEIDFYLPSRKIFAECRYRQDIQSSTLDDLSKYADLYSLRPILFSKNHWGNSSVTGLPITFL